MSVNPGFSSVHTFARPAERRLFLFLQSRPESRKFGVQIALVWGSILKSKESKSVRFDSDLVLKVDQLVPCLDVKALRCIILHMSNCILYIEATLDETQLTVACFL